MHRPQSSQHRFRWTSTRRLPSRNPKGIPRGRLLLPAALRTRTCLTCAVCVLRCVSPLLPPSLSGVFVLFAGRKCWCAGDHIACARHSRERLVVWMTTRMGAMSLSLWRRNAASILLAFCSAAGAVPVTTCRILCFFGGRPGFQFYLKWFSLLLQISRLVVSCMAVFCDDVEADRES